MHYLYFYNILLILLKIFNQNAFMKTQITKNKTLYIFYINDEFHLIPKYSTNSPNKFVTKTALWSIHFLFWQFLIEDKNFCTHIHVCLDEKNDSGYTRNIKIFMEILKMNWVRGKSIVCNYPFIFNYINNKFYISCYDRYWFLKHNLGTILELKYPEYYMDDDEMKLFPLI